jgi:hypothetical protein
LRDLAAQSHDVFLTAVGEDVRGKPRGLSQRHLGRLEPDASLSNFRSSSVRVRFMALRSLVRIDAVKNLDGRQVVQIHASHSILKPQLQ